ncbi:TetR/AcrR family transcriptional regulator [Streptacidiphilus sp. EB129]|uniref:TetR/AcrR family transcriptional regulator n=1 Tax=Streptacidiphilus sp. EB129 TaxID=3156262 RepID=UPI003517B62B
MRTTQRKAQEVADREQMLVQLALEMIRRDGFHNLTLSRLAEESAFSKGTVYNHFTCREDLLIELSAESARRQLRYFQAIADLPWGAVQTLYGLALAYMHHAEVSPVLFECSITARTDAVCALASENRLLRRDLVESQMAQIIGAVVERTVSGGAYANPNLPPPVAVDALRSYILGYAAMHLLSRRFQWAQEQDQASRLHTLASMMQGLGWPALGIQELTTTQKVVTDVMSSLTPA